MNRPRIVAVAAAAIVLIGGGIWFWIQSTEPPATMIGALQPGQLTETQPTPPSGQPGAVAGGVPGPVEGEASTAQAAVTPESAPPPTRSLVLPVKSIHTVTWGQSLWRISRAYYNDPELWPWIFRVNQESIDDPDLIYPDQEVRIPEVP
ncbi:MAG: LysM peptidoglycan-binding domain-containing protein [SAR324 cluster bacterium]|nr:LysM peptidoglycan-binding domain-containing protein [SAR324 cluster bacterium]